MLRAALEFSHPVRTSERADSDRARARLASLLEDIEPLVTSASIFLLTAQLLFTAVLIDTFGVGLALTIAIPSLILFGDLAPSILARRFGDRLLRDFLGIFHVVQFPVGLVVWFLGRLRRILRRTIGLPENPTTTREIVEDLREVIVDTAKTGRLDDHERELIENVMEFRDVDVAAVMTPRTEISGVDVEKGLKAAVQKAAESNHSRIPVYEDNLDNIIGTITARDVMKVAAEGRIDATKLRDVLHPAYFVPETKLVSELLAEFRREKLKMAIVLDEYGGTAGLVTLGDVIEEIVGDIHEEFEEDEPSAVRKLAEGVSEVDASLHVSEVNEELDLDLPEEEDFETLGGFVLAELGRMPKAGDEFRRGNVGFSVVEASERRVLKVRVEQPARKPA